MKGSNRSAIRVDRAALAATFAAALLTVGASIVALQPATALIPAAEVGFVEDDAADSVAAPSAEARAAAGESQAVPAGN